MKKLLMLLMVIGVVDYVQAGIYSGTYSGTFVDAVVGADQASSNTWVSDTATYPNLADWETGSSTANYWWDREGYGEGTVAGSENAILSSNASSANLGDSPMVTTTISGLTPGADYFVSVAYLVDVEEAREDDNWCVFAGLDALSLSYYDQFNGSFTGFDQGGREGREALLGIATADINGEIVVYIDDNANAASSWDRTWYDGVVYSEVPEPVTLMLLGFGGMLLRKRK